MGVDAERAARRWRWVAFASLVVAIGSVAALVVVLVLPVRGARMTDDRLIGTWRSDADRTLAGLREQRPVDEKQEAALRKLFGKLRVTYAPASCVTELEGAIDTHNYEVLGKDRQSVVTRDVRDGPSPLNGIIELSEFTVIQFDGPDSYWLTTPIGIREYFERIR